MPSNLDQQAIDILRSNDRGGYTVPTARLYPYQWNWDSAFVALGFATFDLNRAWRELELLLDGQWCNGLLPHILFRQNDPDYFPGPSVWCTPNQQNGGGKFPSGGISQPPVLASIVRMLIESGGDDSRGKALFEPMLKWHRWYHRDRTPDGFDIVASVHPWETGRDNCPDWEPGLSRMAVDSDIEAYVRRDTVHSDPSQRPSKEQYDKYVTMIKFGRDVGWDQRRLTNEGPFLMADPGIHFILLRADRDLLALAKRFGREDCASEIQGWIAAAEGATNTLWNPELEAFCARDVRSGAFSCGFSSASALCFWADAGTDDQRAATLEHMRRIQAKVTYMLPSWDPDAAMFEPQRYWCGPVWPQMNHIISRGLAEQGEHDLANRIRDDLTALITKSGFRECFDPLTGEGCIGKDFSWTAAMWLAWLSPRAKTEAA
ncbi:MAG: trehalase family glycosidase [Ahrensia sp.]|nr:trehalase family glycosidase [Ahrensia sp.]